LWQENGKKNIASNRWGKAVWGVDGRTVYRGGGVGG